MKEQEKMSLEKTKLRSAAMNEVGNRLDDVLEATKAEMYRAEGGIKTATKALERSLQLTALVDKDLEGGSLDIERAKLVKSYLAKVQSAMKDLALSEEKRKSMAQGMVMGMERAVKETKVMFDREVAKALADPEEDLPTAVASNPVAQRAVGGRPAMTIKEQRLAEEAAEKKSNGAKAVSAIRKKAAKKPGKKAAKRSAKKTTTRKKAAKKTASKTALN